MPCTSKKAEAEIDGNGTKVVDAVITIRELVRLIVLLGIDLNNLEPEPAENAFSMSSSAGRLFGISGGHLEGLMRSINYLNTGQELSPLKVSDLRGLKPRKDTRMRINKVPVNIVAVSGLANAIALMDEIAAGRDDIHIIEVMACPNGCINGGGQRIGSDEKTLKSRMKALYDVDEEEMVKVAHKNPTLNELSDKFLSKPNSERNREVLHKDRSKTPGE
jgi:iron only hydrogenase large subunit-like protein